MKKLILILFLLFISCSEETNNINEIRFNNVNNLPIVRMGINGKPATLLVDTGATSSYIDINSESYYNFIVLDKQGDVGGIGGNTTYSNLKNLQLTYRDSLILISFKAIDLSHVRKSISINGVLGSDWLKKNGALIDYNNNKIILTK